MKTKQPANWDEWIEEPERLKKHFDRQRDKRRAERLRDRFWPPEDQKLFETDGEWKG